MGGAPITVITLLLVTLTLGESSWPWKSQNVTQEGGFCASLEFYSEDCVETVELKSSLENVGKSFKELFGNNCSSNVGNVLIQLEDEGRCEVKVKRNYSEILFQAGKTQNLTNVKITEASVDSCRCFITSSKNGTDFVGVIYSPYDKHPVNHQHIGWWNYSQQDITQQLKIISSEFKLISMYGIGTVKNGNNFTSNWKDSLPIAYAPVALAQINNASGYHKLKVYVGVFTLEIYEQGHFEAEVQAAISASLAANKIFPGSVPGISMHFDVIQSLNSSKYIEKIIRSLKDIRNSTRNEDIKAGLRFSECEAAFEETLNRAEDSARLYCKPSDLQCTTQQPLKLLPQLENLVKESDFLICFIRPPTPLKNETMKALVERLGTILINIKEALKIVKKDLQVFAETGWPSQGQSVNRAPNTLKNMKDYWIQVGLWSLKNNFQVFLFEALDEPWKMPFSKETNKSEADNSVCGSEGYYGWWRRIQNDKLDYLEKALEDQSNSSSIEESTLPEYCTKKEVKLPEGSGSFLNTILISTASLIFCLMVVVLLVLAIRLNSAKKEESKLTQRYLEMFRKGMDPLNLKKKENDYQIIALHFPYDKKKYELDKGSFKIDLTSSIGKGQGGTVYLGRIEGHLNQIAFKTTDSSSSILDIKNLLSEIKIMSYIGHHENIICLVGAYTEKLERGTVYLALEYCPLGNLLEFLQEKGKFKGDEIIRNGFNAQTQNLNYVTTFCIESSGSESEEHFEINKLEYDFPLMVKWAYEIANGMEYLSSKNVVHADLACRNILLTSSKSIKITDFGLSQKLYTEIKPNLVFESDVRLPWRWMAPESLRKLTFSSASDVWSYGVTIWEIFSKGDVPFGGLAFGAQFVTDVEEGMRLDDAKHASDAILDLMDLCWSLEPNDRVDFAELKIQFEKLFGDNVNATCDELCN